MRFRRSHFACVLVSPTANQGRGYRTVLWGRIQRISLPKHAAAKWPALAFSGIVIGRAGTQNGRRKIAFPRIINGVCINGALANFLPGAIELRLSLIFWGVDRTFFSQGQTTPPRRAPPFRRARAGKFGDVQAWVWMGFPIPDVGPDTSIAWLRKKKKVRTCWLGTSIWVVCLGPLNLRHSH